jgi:hypothetical protein
MDPPSPHNSVANSLTGIFSDAQEADIRRNSRRPMRALTRSSHVTFPSADGSLADH